MDSFDLRHARIGVASLLALLVIIGGYALVDGADHARTIFSMADPRSDDYGAGGMTYPLDKAFDPRHGLLDLVHFEVAHDEATVRFDLTFAQIENPFDAPEGFYHPRVDIYVHARVPGGATESLRPGPGVRFSSRYPWHLWLRIAPFEGTTLYTWEDAPDSPGRRAGVSVSRVPDSTTVRVEVSSHLLPDPNPGWRYYVLVGSFDGFGSDGYRAVGAKGSNWLLGSDEGEGVPRVVDMLAPAWGPRRQERQLRATEAGPPVIVPVGGFDPFRISLRWYLAALITLAVVTICLRFLNSTKSSRST